MDTEANQEGAPSAHPPKQRDNTILVAMVCMLASIAVLMLLRQLWGAGTGEPCDHNAEIQCKFGHICVDEVCAPYCETDADCPTGIDCVPLNDDEAHEADADYICDMPTRLEQEIDESLDRALKEALGRQSILSTEADSGPR